MNIEISSLFIIRIYFFNTSDVKFFKAGSTYLCAIFIILFFAKSDLIALDKPHLPRLYKFLEPSFISISETSPSPKLFFGRIALSNS